MEIRQQYLQRYLHDIAIDQLVADYQTKGYLVAKEEKIGNHKADLVARKGDEVIVVEVKTGRMTPKKREQIVALGDYVRSHDNYKFMVVVALPPKRKKIDVPNIDHLLFDYLVHRASMPDELNRLSSNTRITGVEEATIDELTVSEENSIMAKGSGVVEVELQHGSGNDKTTITDAFPLTFDVVLKYNEHQELFLANAKSIEIDTASFYE
ncbi:hypothetical protein [Spirosoma montaniterrae]|uniref:REase AHJR-like domain-containing protein n=1 Tax=Spirosoma montaniterrae TaxID=1178516 RepID=A0A1P9WU45_9BACT|nr:hypothetical protein [Spirosoma montaniterrae]AQG78868.1 hypothetical protein AWR27_05730 [Spirosoma montaniterrae]